MKVVFAGTPEFACVALRRLRGAGFELPLVLTQPDRPAGRGMRLQPSAVKVFAREHGITLAQPRSLRLDGAFPEDAAATRQALTDARAQVMVVAAYGLILPRWVLDFMHQPSGGAPALGCLNIHASLLPRWRGAAPIQRAIEAGDDRTGVTIMQMDAGLDTGDILLAQAIPVKHDGPRADTSGSLHDRLAALGGDLIVRALEQASQGRLEARKQPAEGASYASKVEKACARVDWEGSAQLIERRVRAFNPAPGAWTELGGEMLKVWRAEVAALQGGHGAPCGTVLRVEPDGIDVACGLGVLRLRELQRAGGKRLDVDAYLRGSALRPGMRFGVPPA